MSAPGNPNIKVASKKSILIAAGSSLPLAHLRPVGCNHAFTGWGFVVSGVGRLTLESVWADGVEVQLRKYSL